MNTFSKACSSTNHGDIMVVIINFSGTCKSDVKGAIILIMSV